MGGMYLLVPTFLVIIFSFLIVRAAAIMLMMTGMDKHRAVFQSLSAFSGTGFTTREAELIVNNPRRRKIISWLMILGNAGIVTVIVSTTSSVVFSKGFQLPLNVILMILGLVLIIKILSRRGFIRGWERIVENRLLKRSEYEEGIVEDLLHMIEGNGLVRVVINENSPFAGQTLAESPLREKGMLVLGIERERDWITIPKASERIETGDRLVMYGNLDVLNTVFRKES